MRTRTRVITDEGTITGPYYSRTNGTVTFEWLDRPVATFHHFKKISDVVGNKQGFNPCSHVSITGSPGSWPAVILQYTQQNGTVTTVSDTWVCESSSGSIGVLASCPPHDPSFLSDPALNAFKKFTAQFPGDVSIVNFIIELKEGVKGLLPSLSNLKKLWARGLLSWEFGIKPFLSDLRKLADSYRRAMKRLEFLQKRNFKRTTVHHAERSKFDPLAELEPVDTIGYSSEAFGPPLFHLVEYQATLRFGAVILPKLKGLDSVLAGFYALAATLGLNRPVDIAWEAIPFSWLVDWVVNLDNFIDAFEGKVFEGDIEILETWHSVKVEAKVDVYHTGKSADSNQYDRRKTGQYSVVRYDRASGLPLSPQSLFSDDGLDARQLAILAALIHEKWF